MAGAEIITRYTIHDLHWSGLTAHLANIEKVCDVKQRQNLEQDFRRKLEYTRCINC